MEAGNYFSEAGPMILNAFMGNAIADLNRIKMKGKPKLERRNMKDMNGLCGSTSSCSKIPCPDV
jgi:hypothetical protein